MPIYRCNQCGFVSEDAQTPIHTQTPCGRCGRPSTVYGTVYYVEELIKRLTATTRELQVFRQQAAAPPGTPAPVSGAQPSSPGAPVANVQGLATEVQHEPLKRWFANRRIDVQLDLASVNTGGFFDDAALLLGNGHALFAELIDRIRFAYRKNHSGVTLELANLAQKDAQAINQLCRRLYEHTFFSRYHYQKSEKMVRLTLQTAPAIRQFFDGGWLEWYALLTLLGQVGDRMDTVSCARGVKLVFPNEDLHELDVVALPAGQEPICIECKSGEFRRDIEKYLRLRKRLAVERDRFVICSAELTDEQAVGLSAMYELSFVNLQTLAPHLHRLLRGS